MKVDLKEILIVSSFSEAAIILGRRKENRQESKSCKFHPKTN